MKDINEIMPKIPNMKTKELQRFVSKIEYEPISGCWLWKGTHTNGYGRFKLNYKNPRAHRLAYMYWKGDIPKDLVLDHLCRNSLCVNPNHLEPVTQQENILRGRNRLRELTHCKNGHEFTEENTLVTPVGTRKCRPCRRENERERYQRDNAEN